MRYTLLGCGATSESIVSASSRRLPTGLRLPSPRVTRGGLPRRAALAAVAAWVCLAPGLCHADMAVQCIGSFSSPAHGATHVPLDVVIRGQSFCGDTAPVFTDGAGQGVPAVFATDGDEGFTLTPSTPLSPDTRYRLVFSSAGTCGDTRGHLVFTTGGSPTFRRVEVSRFGGQIHGLTVLLSEPVLDPQDLTTELLRAEIPGYALAPTVTVIDGGVSLSYKANATRPSDGAGVTLTLRKGLRFGSGVTLPDDLRLFVDTSGARSPAYQRERPPNTCEGSAFGCAAAAPGRGPRPAGPWGGLVVLTCVFGMLWTRRTV